MTTQKNIYITYAKNGLCIGVRSLSCGLALLGTAGLLIGVLTAFTDFSVLASKGLEWLIAVISLRSNL